MEEKLISSDLIFALIAKTPDGKIHQVLISQEKLKQNIHLIIDTDSLHLIDQELDSITIDKSEPHDS
jgi:hypothetical protein